ncbi:MAG: lysophospholipase [Candidatus Eisenbacteria bacterium]
MRASAQTTSSSVAVSHCESSLRVPGGLQLFEQSWAPESPRAVVVLVHGFAEHSDRHAQAALHLARRGYAVQSFDLRGHGRSEGKRCFVSAFEEYLDDTEALLLTARRRWSGVPVFLVAQSMGGLIASLCVVDGRSELSGLILSAPAVKLGRDYSVFKIGASLALGRALPHLPMFRLRSSSICRDPAVVRAFDEDGLVYHGRTPARTASEIIRAIRRLQANVERISVPLLVMHGSRDQVADIDGSKELCERAGSSDKSLRVYDGLWHEIMHEPESAVVLWEMSRWLDDRTSC